MEANNQKNVNFDYNRDENVSHHGSGSTHHHSSGSTYHRNSGNSHHHNHGNFGQKKKRKHGSSHRDIGLIAYLFGKIKKIIFKPSKKVRRTSEIIMACLAVILIGIVMYAYIQSERRTQYLEKAEESRSNAEQQSQEQEASEEAERLLQIENGNFYEKLANGYDVNILIVGDSIGAASGASNSAHRWTDLLENYIEETYGSAVTLTNISMGGNTSFAGYVRTMIIEDDVDYDLAVICYGQNDNETNFSLYYETIITAIRSKFEDCSIISILESSQQGYTNKITTIEEICEYYSIPTADTIAPFLEYYNFYTDDGTHPNDDGQVIYAETVAEVIDKQVEANIGVLEYDIEPINADVMLFANCEYINAKDFTRISNTAYTIDITTAGILGIDYTYMSGENKMEIYIDGKLVTESTVTFPYDFSQRHIIILSKDCAVEQEITIVFDNEDQADGFYGICFCYQ